MIIGYTPVELRLLRVLSDGDRHSAEELLTYLSDDMGSLDNVAFHMSNLRKKLAKSSCSILCEKTRARSYYRLVVYYGAVEGFSLDPRLTASV